MNGSSGVSIQMPPVELNKDLEYSVMYWMRPSAAEWNQQQQVAFNFENSLQCIFTRAKNLECQSLETYNRLVVDVSTVQANQWTHITLSGSQYYEESYLIVENNQQQIGFDDEEYINLKQIRAGRWRFCLGGCSSSYSFVGGVRELIMLNRYVTQEQASRMKNHYLIYDNSILAYYRFSEKNFNSDEFRLNQTVAVTTDNQMRDYISNDICQAIKDYGQFLEFIPRANPVLQSVSMDNRWEMKVERWEYSFSTWIRIKPDTCFTTNITRAEQSCHWIKLDGQFFIYQPTRQSLAIFFDTQNGIYAQSSRQVFLPLDQWVNIEIKMSMYVGYTIQVYDILGRQISQVQEQRNLQQTDGGKSRLVTLFRGFSGFVQNVILLQQEVNLPFDSVKSGTTYPNNSCLIHYKFSPENITPVRNSTFQTGLIRNLCNHTNRAYNLTLPMGINETLNFTYVQWKAYEFNSGAKDGLIENTAVLFDGLACNDDQQVPLMLSNRSSFRTVLPRVQNTLSNLTVEFWFRANFTANRTQYLFSLWAQNNSNEFFSMIYDETNALLCAPFGMVGLQSPFLNYSDFNDINRASVGWQHIVCQYEQRVDIQGFLFRQNQTVRSYQYAFQPTQQQFLPADTYEVYVGNSKNGSRGTVNLMLKDLKVWAIKRDQQSISDWRNRQFDPRSLTSSGILLAYLRLSEANYQEFNFALYNNQSASIVTSTNMMYNSSLNPVICPLGTFYSSVDNKCYANPVQKIVYIVYPQVFTNGSINWIFSFRAQLVDTIYQNDIALQWTFEDQLLNHFIQADNISLSTSQVRLPSTYFIDQSLYHFKVSLKTPSQPSISSDLTFIPNSCWFYNIQNAQDPVSAYLNFTQQQSTQDISFNIILAQIKSTCAQQSYFNTLLTNISYYTVPYLENKPQLQFSVNSTNQNINVRIPKEEQYKLPTKQDVQFIINLQWTNNNLGDRLRNYINDQATIFQSVVQTININNPSIVVVSNVRANQTNILRNESVIIDTRGTYLLNAGANDFDFLRYSWTCPEAFVSLCTANQDKLNLTISYNDFVNLNGSFGRPYVFSVNISYDRLNRQAFQLTEVTLTWQDLPSNNFQLNFSSPVRATTPNIFKVLFFNSELQANVSNFTYTWTFSPANVNQSLVQFSNSNSELSLQPNALQRNINYTLSVTIYNTSQQTETTKTVQVRFMTQQPPFGGNATISPQNGVANETNFTIQIFNWQSAQKPIRYRVWNTDQNYQPSALMTSDWIQDSQSFRFKAPTVNPYIVEITDQTQEVSQVLLTPLVTSRVNGSINLNALNQTVMRLNSRNDPQSLILKYATVDNLANGIDAQTPVKFNETQFLENARQRQLRSNLISMMLNDVEKINPQFITNKRDRQDLLTRFVNALASLVNDENYLDKNTASAVGSITKTIQALPDSNELMSSNAEYRKDISTIYSSLLMYRLSKVVKIGRFLQTDDAETLDFTFDADLNEIKKSLLNGLCSTLTPENSYDQMDAKEFSLYVQMIYKDSSVTETKFFDNNTSIDFDIQQLQQVFTYQKSINSICLQSIFYHSNPQPKDLLVQYSNNILELDFVDDLGNDIQQSFNQKQIVKMTYGLDSYQDTQKVATCLAYSGSRQEWVSTYCESEFDMSKKEMTCRCSMIDAELYGVFETVNNQSSQAQTETVTPNSNPQTESSSQPSLMETEHSLAFLSVVAILLSIAIVVPSLSIILDKKDFRIVMKQINNKRNYNVIEILTQLSDKPQNYWLFKQEDITTYANENKTLFSILLTQLHPFISIFTKYDASNSRLQRLSVYLIQISIYALACTFIYSPNYRRGDERMDSGLDATDINSVLLVGFLGMFVLLPIPINDLLFKVKNPKQGANVDNLKTAQINYVAEYTSDNHHYHNQSPQLTTININKTKNATLNHSGKKLQDDGIISHRQVLPQVIVPLQSSCKPLKYLLLTLAYICCLFTFGLGFIYSSEMPVSNQYCLVASFYIGFFGSFFLSNFLRIILCTFLVSRASSSACIRLLVSSEATKIYEEIQLVRKAKEISRKEKNDNSIRQIDENHKNEEERDQKTEHEERQSILKKEIKSPKKLTSMLTESQKLYLSKSKLKDGDDNIEDLVFPYANISDHETCKQLNNGGNFQIRETFQYTESLPQFNNEVNNLSVCTFNNSNLQDETTQNNQQISHEQ